MKRSQTAWDGPCSDFYGATPGSYEEQFCWNCELEHTLNGAPGFAEMHFCSPGCEQVWWASQPLVNLIEKRRCRRQGD